MIARSDFLDLLWKWKDHDLIKVVTGVRLRDNYPKTVVTLDAVPPSSEDGITCVNAIDFLLGRG